MKKHTHVDIDTLLARVRREADALRAVLKGARGKQAAQVRAALAAFDAIEQGFATLLEQSREWGAAGGQTRAKRLSPDQRAAIARRAARARWAK